MQPGRPESAINVLITPVDHRAAGGSATLEHRVSYQQRTFSEVIHQGGIIATATLGWSFVSAANELRLVLGALSKSPRSNRAVDEMVEELRKWQDRCKLATFDG